MYDNYSIIKIYNKLDFIMNKDIILNIYFEYE